jgi:hypothetical protein
LVSPPTEASGYKNLRMRPARASLDTNGDEEVIKLAEEAIAW